MPFVYVVDCLVEVFEPIYFHGVLGSIRGNSGVGMLCGLGATGCVRGFFVVEGVLVRVIYDVGVCSGRSVFFMYACHVGCMSVVFVV